MSQLIFEDYGLRLVTIFDGLAAQDDRGGSRGSCVAWRRIMQEQAARAVRNERDTYVGLSERELEQG